ncbi:MAG: hypothetical protein FWG09_02980 [Synergistaceae bacterium]|nr:hypothetical protein [Synergistaceae bacterium]
MPDPMNTNALCRLKSPGGVGLPTLIIAAFWVSILVGAYIVDISILTILGDTLKRAGMNGVLVLAMVPAIQSGTGPNFALPIGIVCGLFALVCAIELNLMGVSWLLASIIFSIPLAVFAGYVYGKLLNAVKGSEMTIATYSGFSITALMCLAWLMIPFSSPKMGWFIGEGLRETIQLGPVGASQLLNNFLSFIVQGEMLLPADRVGDLLIMGGAEIIPTITNEEVMRILAGEVIPTVDLGEGIRRGGEIIPTVIAKGPLVIPTVNLAELLNDGAIIKNGALVPSGMLLVFGFFSVLVWLYFRTKSGVAISAGGINPKFAQAAGLNIDRNRVLANILSTVLGAIGIIIYSQSYGYAQLYTAPLMMAFPAVAAILIGGATASRASVFNVVVGVLVFQGLLTAALPVANEVFAGTDLSEIMRAIIQNGIILYALTQVKRGG